jgi:hypothetical protein
MQIVVTGPSGFVGPRLLAELVRRDTRDTPSPGANKAHLIELVKMLNLDARVQFVGRQPLERMPAILAGCTARASEMV